ncbi:MAG TPA: class I SAM-dependent methyltransferase [Polyangiaceae bacterium]|nr:class I SAM-dependent methyltransferase [Polyangiaceae bacterium]
MENVREFLPAAGRDELLPFYDPLVRLIGGDRRRRRLIEQAALRPGLRVLDVGCGTGTLLVDIQRRESGITATGLDPDPKALSRARRKAERAGVSVRFDQGFSDQLPYADASFDRVFSSFMLHHLKADEQERTLREVRRVLVPGGSLHLLDFVQPLGGHQSVFARLVHAHESMDQNTRERLLALLEQAGFSEAKELARRRMALQPIAYFRAVAAASS